MAPVVKNLSCDTRRPEFNLDWEDLQRITAHKVLPEISMDESLASFSQQVARVGAQLNALSPTFLLIS